jgi:hypothetical protein
MLVDLEVFPVFPHFGKPHFEFRSPCFRTCGAFIWKPRSGKNLRQSQAVSQAMWPLPGDCYILNSQDSLLCCFKMFQISSKKKVEICWDVWKQLTLRARIPECTKDVGWSTPKGKTARNHQKPIAEESQWKSRAVELGLSMQICIILDLSGKLKGCRNAQNRRVLLILQFRWFISISFSFRIVDVDQLLA